MTDIERILQAIKAQRWYFFANNPKILMDRDTSLLWANLNYFPYLKNNNQGAYSNSNDYSEVKTLISNINSENWGGFSDWKIPTPFELWKMIEDKSFPSHRDYTYVISWNHWCVYYNDIFASKNIEKNGATADISNDSVYVIPCSRFYVPNDYENNISPSNNYYTETEKLQLTLNVFVENNLIPLFNEEEITQLYRKIFIEKPSMIQQLEVVESKIADLQTSKVKLPANFDYKLLIKKFDTTAIDKSAIRYYEAVLSVVDELLATLPENDTSKAVADKKRKLSFVKDQAESFFQRLDEINTGYDSIRELAKLESEPRTSFAFLVESLTRIINEKT